MKHISEGFKNFRACSAEVFTRLQGWDIEYLELGKGRTDAVQCLGFWFEFVFVHRLNFILHPMISCMYETNYAAKIN